MMMLKKTLKNFLIYKGITPIEIIPLLSYVLNIYVVGIASISAA